MAAVTVTKVGTDTVVTVTAELRIPASVSDSIVFVDFADVFSIPQSRTEGGISIPASASLISLINSEGATISDFGASRYWTDEGTGLRLAIVGNTTDIGGKHIRIRAGTMVFSDDVSFNQPDLAFQSVQLITGKGGGASSLFAISAVTVPEPGSTLLAGLGILFFVSRRGGKRW